MTKLYESKANILDAVRRVITRNNNVQEEWQKIALSALNHTLQHGDKTVPAKVVEGITKCNGVTKSKMTKYLEFGLNATFVEGAFNYLPGASHKDINIEQAEAVKWYNYKTDAGDTSKDLLALFEMFTKQAKRSLAKEKITQDQIDIVKAAFSEAADEEIRELMLAEDQQEQEVAQAA